DFAEIHRVPRVMVLQPNVAGIWAWAAHRLEPLLARRHRLIPYELVHFFSVQNHDRLLILEMHVHRVPFASWLLILHGDFYEKVVKVKADVAALLNSFLRAITFAARRPAGGCTSAEANPAWEDPIPCCRRRSHDAHFGYSRPPSSSSFRTHRS